MPYQFMSSIQAGVSHRNQRATAIPLVIIDHETNSLAQWTTDSSAGKCTVTAAAAMNSSNYGMSMLIDSTTARYMQKTGLASTTGKARLRWYVDPNTLTMANNDQFYICGLYTTAGARVANLNMKMNTGAYQLVTTLVDDAAADQTMTAKTITDAPHCVEIYLQRASSSVASDGSIELLIDGVSKGSVTGKDNYDRFANWGQFWAGAVAGVDAGTSGTFYLDEFYASETTVEIGP